MGFLTKVGLARETNRTRAEVERLPSLGLPHEVVGGRAGEVRIDRQRAMAWLAGVALGAGDGPDAAAPAIVRERARLVREQADNMALRNKAARGRLLPAEEVVAGWQAAIGRSLALLLGLPPPAAARLVLLVREHENDAAAAERAIRESLTRAIDAALAELASTHLDEFDDGKAEASDGEAVGA
jgi:phage terminase Nu1 subunit (DNA packaging protein)